VVIAMGWTTFGSPAKSVTLNPCGNLIDCSVFSTGTGAGASAAKSDPPIQTESTKKVTR
jgi:hypothetical protein